MQNPTLTKWSNDQKLDGLLFFAQLIVEEIDTHKLPALNTFRRCTEGLFFIKQVENNLIPENALDSIVEEFLWSFRVDPIIDGIFWGKKWYYHEAVKDIKKDSGLRGLKSILRLIKVILYQDYLEEAVRQLKRTICEKPENRDLIYSLTRSFLTELIFYGYSQEFISSKTKRFFFDSDNSEVINSPNQIDEYLDNFNLEKKEFDVEFKTKKVPDFIKNLAKDENHPEELDIEVKEKKKDSEDNNEEYPYAIIFKKVKAYAPERARDMADERMRFLASLVKYRIHKGDFSWHNVSKLKLSNNEPQHMTPKVEAVHRRPNKEPDEISEEVKKIIDLIFEDQLKDRKDRKDISVKIFWALKLHEMAISAKTREVQLQTLWCSIEGILRPPSKNKMVYILYSIVPLIIADYPKKLISHIKKNLDVCGDSEVTKIIEEVDVGTNPFEKLAAIISIDDEPYKTYREELSSLLRDKNNVLLIDRLITFNKMLNSAKTIKSTIEYNRDLVEWHVQRIYRMRNLMAHSIERLVPSYYTDNLIANLHSYLDRIINLLLTTSMKNPNIKTVEEIISEISVDVRAHLGFLETKKGINCIPENYSEFLFGPK